MIGYVILSGPPASGKSTLGPVLAESLELPYLAKDTIKRALIAELGAVDVEASRRLGGAAMRALVAVAAEAGGGVLDGSWLRDRSASLVRLLDGPLVEVFCRCSPEELQQRYVQRATTRGPGHFDQDRSWSELWGEQTSEPVDDGWPVVEVDTRRAVDVSDLARVVRNALQAECAL